MIQVHILKAKKNTVFRKNGTFLEGELYFGRMSKDGRCYVVRSEEGYWIPVEEYRMTVMKDRRNFFDTQTWFLTRSRKDLNNIDSVQLLLEDFYKCEQCGFNVPYCNDCV